MVIATLKRHLFKRLPKSSGSQRDGCAIGPGHNEYGPRRNGDIADYTRGYYYRRRHASTPGAKQSNCTFVANECAHAIGCLRALIAMPMNTQNIVTECGKSKLKK